MVDCSGGRLEVCSRAGNRRGVCRRSSRQHRGGGGGSIAEHCAQRQHRRRRRIIRTAAPGTSIIDARKTDDDTFGLVRDGLRVDVVVAIVVHRAGVEDVRPVVLQVPVVVDAETRRRGGARVALELRRRRGQDAAAAVAVHDLAVLDAKGRGFVVGWADADLAVRELADGAVDGAVAFELEAAFLGLAELEVAQGAGVGVAC